MRVWEVLVLGGIGLFAERMINSANEAAEERERVRREEEKRKSKRCCFCDGITMEEFCQIVKQSVRHIKRVTILPINDSIVYGKVRTNSGLNEWSFEIDFNDYGHLTGKYWLQSDNEESDIPTIIAEKVSTMIRSFPDGFKQSKTSSRYAEYGNLNVDKDDSINTNDEENDNFEKIWRKMGGS